MKIDDVELTLGNYSTLLKDFPLEIQDELLTAMIYGVDITPFLYVNLGRPELLRQIKWALLENVNPEFLQTSDWRVLKKIRSLVKDGVNLQLPKGTPLWALDSDVLLFVLEWLRGGVNLDGYDLRLLTKEAAEVINIEVLSGSRLPQFCTGFNKPKAFFQGCLSLWKRGRSVDNILSQDWDASVLSVLASIPTDKHYYKVLKVASPEWKKEDAVAAFNCIKNRIDLETLSNNCKKEGEPLSAWRMAALLQAKLSDLDLTDFEKAELTQPELFALLETRKRLVKNRKIRLKK